MYAELSREGIANSPLSIMAKYIMVVPIAMCRTLKRRALTMGNYGA